MLLRRTQTLWFCLLAALLASLTACSSGSAGAASAAQPNSSSSASAPSGAPASLQRSYADVIRTVLPSVVEIRTDVGLGSGVLYDDNGDIVTNAHVVGTAHTFQVQYADKSSPVPATLVGVYRPDDLAVIRTTQTGDARPATFAKAGDAHVGDLVLAMGNPLGLESSVTDGIVSATGRTVTEPAGEGSPGTAIPGMVQTSAAINPGNSGGALVDLDGRVIGIPTLAAQNNGSAAPGIGFAIASGMVQRIADQLIGSGKVTHSGRAALGVSVRTVASSSGDPVGVGVVDVRNGSPAAKAGLRAGDVITAVAGTRTPTTGVLSAVLANRSVGDTVQVQYRREGSQSSTVKVTLGELSAG